VIANPSFELGVSPCASTPNQLCPVSWDLATCEGVANATIALDNTRAVAGAESARISTGPLTATGCFSGNFTGRAVGFSQFRTSIQGPTNQGYNFTQLTNDPNGFSFWFQLQPLNGNGIAGFEVRIFGAESLSELDYVFDPDPSIGQFQDNTGTHSILFYGYQPGQWYHFSRDLRADWMAPTGPSNAGLSLNYNFTLLQFQGFASNSGGVVRSESFWLDDVRAYVGPGSILVPSSDFAVSTNLSSLTVYQNSTFTPSANVTLTSVNGFSGLVNLSTQVNPAGAISSPETTLSPSPLWTTATFLPQYHTRSLSMRDRQ